MIAEGHRVGRIADRLSIAEVTVGLHLKNARKKLKARTMAEAVAKAVRHRQVLGTL
jgi:DNA-binding CsgD family transcriptional regulator